MDIKDNVANGEGGYPVVAMNGSGQSFEVFTFWM